ncbi:TetR/AcrR family transcriptional regulator [Cytobacillus sp. NJ13]|nr:TetR/AcrR family transcriptional regulator [Cytobacillus sp. NJ13]
METRTDRRILRTKKAINKAFLELFEEKEFDRITINDITERADVNRGTFYLHYTDKYALLAQCIDDHLSGMFNSPGFSKFMEKDVEEAETIEGLRTLFLYVEENFSLFFSLLSNRRTSTFRERMLLVITSLIQDKIDMDGVNQNMDKTLIVDFMALAFVGTVENWIINGMPQPPQLMAEQMWVLLKRNGIK